MVLLSKIYVESPGNDKDKILKICNCRLLLRGQERVNSASIARELFLAQNRIEEERWILILRNLVFPDRTAGRDPE